MQAILQWGQAVQRLSVAVHGIVSLGWLSDVCSTYRECGLKEDAKRVQIEMKKRERRQKSRWFSLRPQWRFATRK